MTASRSPLVGDNLRVVRGIDSGFVDPIDIGCVKDSMEALLCWIPPRLIGMRRGILSLKQYLASFRMRASEDRREVILKMKAVPPCLKIAQVYYIRRKRRATLSWSVP